MENLEKFDKVLGLFGNILNTAITLACVFLSGFIAYKLLAFNEYTGLMLWGGTVLIALAGAMVLKLLFWIVVLFQ